MLHSSWNLLAFSSNKANELFTFAFCLSFRKGSFQLFVLYMVAHVCSSQAAQFTPPWLMDIQIQWIRSWSFATWVLQVEIVDSKSMK